MDPLQTVICEKNDYMTDVLAEQAEAANLSPKNKYKQIVKLASAKQNGRDVDDKVQNEYLKMELFQNGLEAVNDINQQTNIN
jgi:DNA-binding ferritin-like protein